MKIALLGPSNAGKTSAANFLKSEFEYEIVHTGKIVRVIAEILFGNQSKSTLSRVANAISSLGSNVVLDAALRGACSSDKLVFDCVRNTDELAYVRQNGFVLLKIERPLSGTVDVPQDRFETFYQNVECNFTYSNTGSLDALHSFLASFIQSGD